MVELIAKYYESKIDQLYADDKVRETILNTVIGQRVSRKENNERKIFDRTFNAYLEEAKISVSLLDHKKVDKKIPILEVGGGVGLTYAFLQQAGYNIYALEPSDSGFNNYFDAGKELFRVLGVSADRWYNYLGQDAHKINQIFDFIFSNNVLEHIPALEETLAGLQKVLSDGGEMVHNTVNYNVPYEPHFGIMLIPFFPRSTQKLKPELVHNEMWKGLNFITTGSLRKMSSNLNLDIQFKKNIFFNALNRVLTDPGFASRHKNLIPIVKVLKTTRLLNLFKLLPISLSTPIIFTLKKK